MEKNKKGWADYISYLNNITITDTDKKKFFKNKAPKLLDSNEFITEAVEQNGLLLKYASKKLQDDYDIVLKAVQQNGEALEFASENLSNNKDIIYAGITTATRSVLKFVPEKFRNIKKLILEAVKYRPEELLYVADELRNDLNFLIRCIKTNHRAYLYIPKQFIHEPQLFLALLSKLYGPGFVSDRKNDSYSQMVNNALYHKPTIIEYLPPKYKNDRKTIIKAITSYANYYQVYKVLIEEFKNDLQIVLISLVSARGYYIKYLYKELPNQFKNDIHIIKLISCLYDNIDKIPDEIKENKDLDIATIKKINIDYSSFVKTNNNHTSNKIEYKSFSEELKNNREIAIISIIKSNGEDYKFIPSQFKKDIEIIKLALYLNGEMIRHMPKKIKENNAYALMAIDSNGSALRFLSDKYKKDKEFVLKAVKNGASIEYLDEDFKNDKEIVSRAAENNWREFEFASEELRNDKAFISQVLDALDGTDKRRSVFNSLPDELRTNKKFCLKLVSKHWGLYSILNSELKDDMDILLEAMKQDDYPIHWASERLQTKRDYILKNFYKLSGATSVENDGYFNSQLKKYRNELEKFTKYFKIKVSPENINRIVSVARGQIEYQINERSFEATKIHMQSMLGFYLGEECIKKAGGKWKWEENSDNLHYPYYVSLNSGKEFNPFTLVKRRLDFENHDVGPIYDYYIECDKTEEAVNEICNLEELILELDRLNKNKSAKKTRLPIEYLLTLIDKNKFSVNDLDTVINYQKSIDFLNNSSISDNLTNWFNNYEFVLQAVLQNGLLLKYASKKLQNNFNIVLKAVQTNPLALEFASENNLNNKEIVMAAISTKNKQKLKGEVILKFVSKKLLSTKYIIFEAIQYNAEEFKYASDKLKNDDKFVLKCIKRNFEIYHDLPDELKKIDLIILEAIQYNTEHFKHTSDILMNDKSFVVNCIKRNFEIYRYLPDNSIKIPEIFRELLLNWREFGKSFVDWKIDRENIKTFPAMLKVALNENGLILKYLPRDLRNDEEIALLAMNSRVGHGEIPYQYLSEDLKNNREISKLSIKSSAGRSYLYIYMPQKFINDKEFIDLALSYKKTTFKAFPKEYRDDIDFVLKAIKNRILVTLEYLNDSLRNDADIVLSTMGYYSYQFQFASARLRNDEAFVLKAMQASNNPEQIFKYSSKKLRNNKEFCLKALEIELSCLKFITDQLRDDEDIIIKAMQLCNGTRTAIDNREVEIFKSSSKQLRSNKEFCLKAIRITWSCIRFISEQLKDDDDIIHAALETNDVAINYASKRIKENKEDFINNYYKLAGVNNLQENARFVRIRQGQLRWLESRIKYDWHIKLSIKNIDKILQEGVNNNDYKVESIRERDKNELIGFLGFYLGEQFIDKVGGEWKVEDKPKIKEYPYYVLLDNGKLSNPFEHVKNCVADWRDKIKIDKEKINDGMTWDEIYSITKNQKKTSDCLTKYYKKVTG